MRKIIISIFLCIAINAYSISNDKMMKSLCDFLVSEGVMLKNDTVTGGGSSVYVEELINGGNDFSQHFGVYLFNYIGAYDFINYILIKENKKYWIYKENSPLKVISHLLNINEQSPTLLSDSTCLEYIKRINVIKETPVIVGKKEGIFFYINNPE